MGVVHMMRCCVVIPKLLLEIGSENVGQRDRGRWVDLGVDKKHVGSLVSDCGSSRWLLQISTPRMPTS